MDDAALPVAIATVPTGRWAVGVSGGADSVALLSLLRDRADLSLHVVHLDHEARGEASAADAEFVRDLASRWQLPSTVVRWRDLSPFPIGLPANRSARFRAGRFHLFRRVVAEHDLLGVILAHHADDVAETVLQRLLRGSGPTGLPGLKPIAKLSGLPVLRPLLSIRRQTLLDFLRARGQRWREDESNTSRRYQRNRLRAALRHREPLVKGLLELGGRCATLRDWVRQSAPQTPPELPVRLLNDLPAPLATETARRWLAGRGAPPEDLSVAVVARLMAMAADAATPSRQHYPGALLVRRRAGVLAAEPDETSSETGPG